MGKTGIISSREQRKKFDEAIKEVMKQRKAINQTQNAKRDSLRHSKGARELMPSNSQLVVNQQQGRRDVGRHRSRMRRSTTSMTNDSFDEELERLRSDNLRRLGTNTNDSGGTGSRNNSDKMSSSGFHPPNSPQLVVATTDDSRRPSLTLNKSKSFKMDTAPQNQPQASLRRVTSETGSLMSMMQGANDIGGGIRSVRNPRLAQPGSSGFSSNYKPMSKSGDNQGDGNHVQGGPSKTRSHMEGNQVRPDSFDDELRALMDASGAGSQTVDCDAVNGLGRIGEGQQSLKHAAGTSFGDIKLQDLVPTLKWSPHKNSEWIAQKLEFAREDSVGFDRNSRGEERLRSPCGSDSAQASEIGKPKEMGDSTTSSPSSRKIASSGDASCSPSRAILQQLVDRDDKLCPRSQYGLSDAQKSQSGNTGKTQGTSASSLFSSDGSEADPAREKNRSTEIRAITGNFEAIKEEARDNGGSTGNSEQQEMLSDKFDVVLDLSTHKKKQSSRIKKIRKSIRKSLLGINEGGDSEVVSHVGSTSTISVEQQQLLSRHLQRKSSSRSIVSRFSSASGTGMSDETSMDGSTSSRWSRSRLLLIGRSKSMMNLGKGDKNSRRRQMLVATKGQSSSNVSNLSSGSNTSFQSGEKPSVKCTAFYDDNDHAQAISSLVEANSLSGWSQTKPLETVKEPAYEGLGERGEQKQDEDFHNNMRGSLGKSESAYQVYLEKSNRSASSTDSFFSHPSHEHILVHMCPNQIFPDSPGWQCDECLQETFDPTIWAYISTVKNYVLCECCFTKSGFPVGP